MWRTPPSSLTGRRDPEGRSVVVLAKERYGLRERHQGELTGAEWISFTAQTRMSGVDVDGRRIRRERPVR